MAEEPQSLNLPEGFVPTPVEDVLPEGFVPTPVGQEEDDDKSSFQDIGQGIGAGLVNIAQGVVELGALGVDAAADTDYSRDVTDFFEGSKEALAFTPTGGAGKVAEGIVTFGSAAIPIVGWLGRANAVARGSTVVPGVSRFAKTAEKFGKSKVGKTMLGNKAKLAASTSLATGAADVFIAPSTFNTMSDSFDALPDFLETEEDIGLTGSEEAFRRLRNKLRIGTEGVAAGAAFEAAMPVLGGAARAGAKIPGVPAASRALTSAFDLAGQKLSGGRLQKYFTAQGLAPREVYEGIQDVTNVIDASTREAANRFKKFDTALKKVVGKSKLFGRGKEGIDKAYNDLYTFLIGGFKDDGSAVLAQRYGDDVAKAAQEMRDQVDGLTDVFMRSVEDSNLQAAQKKELIRQFSKSQGKYLRRMYEMHLRPEEFVVDLKLYDKAVGEVANVIQKKSGLVGDELTAEAKQVVNNTLYKQSTEAGVELEQALQSLEKAFKPQRKATGERALFNIAQGMLKDRKKWMNQTPTLREMMGEVTDPKELYLRTVGDMAQTITANQFYRSIPMETLQGAITKIRAGGKPSVIDGRTVNPEEAVILERNGYRRLGELAADAERKDMSLAEQAFGGKYGALTGSFVRNEVADSLTIAGRAQDPLQEALALSLQAKGLSQMTKTVLNPLSQIRNFHSGVFMVGANGNIARDMDIMESARLTIGRLADMEDAEFARTFNLLQKAGIVDQNYVVNEFRELLKEGADLKVSGKVSDVSKKIMQKLPFVQSISKGAQNVYSGTDNYWKTVGYLGEKAKYTNAIRRGTDGTTATMDDIAEEFTRAGLAPRSSVLTKDMDFMDVMSTDIVKSTMPTYSRVPEAIKQIRRIPFIGNFMAFPAEIIRTTTNITRQGLRELGYKIDPNSALYAKLGPKKAKELERQVRAIGSKRLSNYLAMAYITPIAAQKAAMEITDFTQDQLAALERLAPYYMKGHTLMPIRNEQKDGKPVIEYVDLSYMMPYDFMVAPVRAAMQAYEEKGEVTDSDLAKIGSATVAGLLKITEPFASEALLAERIADVTLRNGRTKTGAEIFVEGENPMDRTSKIVTHILGGFNPGLVEMFYRERRGELEPGRVTKALTGEPGRYGEEYTPEAEAASMLTGFRELKADLDRNFYYKGAEYTTKRSDLVGSFTSYAKRNDVTKEDILNKYVQVNQDLMKVQAGLLADIQAAESLGLSRAEVIRQLREKAKIGKEELGYLLNGKFRPINISRGLVESILQESLLEGQPRLATELPIQEMMQINTQLRSQTVQPEDEGEIVDGVLPQGFVPTPAPAAPTPQSNILPQGFVPTPAPAAPTPITPAQVENKRSTILGTASNPIAALRDLEIFQRSQGQ